MVPSCLTGEGEGISKPSSYFVLGYAGYLKTIQFKHVIAKSCHCSSEA